MEEILHFPERGQPEAERQRDARGQIRAATCRGGMGKKKSAE